MSIMKHLAGFPVRLAGGMGQEILKDVLGVFRHLTSQAPPSNEGILGWGLE